MRINGQKPLRKECLSIQNPQELHFLIITKWTRAIRLTTWTCNIIRKLSFHNKPYNNYHNIEPCLHTTMTFHTRKTKSANTSNIVSLNHHVHAITAVHTHHMTTLQVHFVNRAIIWPRRDYSPQALKPVWSLPANFDIMTTSTWTFSMLEDRRRIDLLDPVGLQ